MAVRPVTLSSQDFVPVSQIFFLTLTTNIESPVTYNIIQRVIGMAEPIIGALIQLTVGILSDRSSYKHGRRRIFILVGLGFFVAGVLLMMVFLIFPVFIAENTVASNFNISMICDCVNVCRRACSSRPGRWLPPVDDRNERYERLLPCVHR